MQPLGPLTKLVEACDELGRELGMPDWNTAWGVRPEYFRPPRSDAETLGDDESVEKDYAIKDSKSQVCDDESVETFPCAECTHPVKLPLAVNWCPKCVPHPTCIHTDCLDAHNMRCHGESVEKDYAIKDSKSQVCDESVEWEPVVCYDESVEWEPLVLGYFWKNGRVKFKYVMIEKEKSPMFVKKEKSPIFVNRPRAMM